MEAFLVSTGVVTLGEIGNKTQRLAMMIAGVLTLFVGDRLAKNIPMALVHGIAATIFAVLGLLTLFNVGSLF